MNNNKLIAEFMELPTEVSKAGLLNYYHREYNSGTWYEEHELSYNVSWDWLMPVIHKCFDVAEDGDMEDIMHHLQVADMKSTYQAVIEFIEIMNRIENLKEEKIKHIKSKFGHLDTIRKDKFTIQEEGGHFMFIPDSFEELAMDNDEEADSQGDSEILKQIEKAINYE